MRSFKIGVLAVLGAAAAASADTVNLQLTGQGPGQSITVVANGTTTAAYAGSWLCALSGGTGVATGASGIYSIFSASVGAPPASRRSLWTATQSVAPPAGSGDPIVDAARAQAIHSLFGSPLAGQISSDAQAAAAFQIALWETAYDYIPGQASSLDLASGNLRVLSADGSPLAPALAGRVSDLLQSIGDRLGPQPGLLALNNVGGNEMLVVIAPLPPAAAMGIAGLAVAAAVRRRVRSGV